MERCKLSTDIIETPITTTEEPPIAVLAPRGSTRWNAIARFGAYGCSILINLFTIPFLISKLGVEAYGVIGIIASLINIMSIATSALTSTVGRNMTFRVERREFEEANKEISTAVFATIRIFLFAALPLCILAFYIEYLIKIPAALVSSAHFLFLITAVSFAISTLSGPIGASMFVRNRLDIFSGIALLRSIFFLALLVFLFNSWPATFITYGIAVLASSILVFVLTLRYHYVLLPGISISARWYDKKNLHEIVALGGWMTVIQIGMLLYMQSDLLVANRVLGVLAAGQLAAISVIPIQLRSLSALIIGLFAPNQTALAAQGDYTKFNTYLLRTVRIMTLSMAVFVGIFCGSAQQILSLWLGESFGSFALLAIVFTAHLVINLGVLPLGGALLALGNLKSLAISTLILGVVNVLMCIFLAGTLQMGLMGIAIADLVTITLRNLIYTPWLTARICGLNYWSLMREIALGVAATLVISGISYGFTAFFQPKSLLMLAVVLICAMAVSGLAVLPFILKSARVHDDVANSSLAR